MTNKTREEIVTEAAALGESFDGRNLVEVISVLGAALTDAIASAPKEARAALVASHVASLLQVCINDDPS